MKSVFDRNKQTFIIRCSMNGTFLKANKVSGTMYYENYWFLGVPFVSSMPPTVWRVLHVKVEWGNNCAVIFTIFRKWPHVCVQQQFGVYFPKPFNNAGPPDFLKNKLIWNKFMFLLLIYAIYRTTITIGFWQINGASNLTVPNARLPRAHYIVVHLDTWKWKSILLF
jgi:hypothetical protein